MKLLAHPFAGPFDIRRVRSSAPGDRFKASAFVLVRLVVGVGVFPMTCFCLTGCTDKAEPGFRKCEQLEVQHKLDEALAACQAARAADPRTPFGELATKKEVRLLDALAARRKNQTALEDQMKDQARIQEAESKVRWQLESTPPNDKHAWSERCMAASRDFENSYSCKPVEPTEPRQGESYPLQQECMLIASVRGCKPMDPNSPSQLFCCTK